MKTFALALIGTLALGAAAQASINPLDLTAQVSSISCKQINGAAELNVDVASGEVTLVNAAGEQKLALQSLRKSTGESVLVARSAQLGYLLANIVPNLGQSTVQVGGSYFYARCEVK